MLLFYKRLILFIGFIALNPTAHFASAPLIQLEEGWRWRQNLDVYLSAEAEEGKAAAAETSSLFYGPIPAQTCHEMLAKHERRLSGGLPASTNIVLAALTIVLREGERLYATTEVLKGRPQIPRKRPREEQAQVLPEEPFKPYFFPSAADTPDSSPWIKPPRVGRSNIDLWAHVKMLVRDLHGLDERCIEGFGLPEGAPEPRSTGFNREFQHSEQKLIHYLWDFSTGTVSYEDSGLYKHLLQTIALKELTEKAMSGIEILILHVHSTRDPCSRCSLALSLFALKTRTLIRETTGNPNFQFIVTISSRYPYEERRTRSGHGTRYSHPIVVKTRLSIPAKAPVLPAEAHAIEAAGSFQRLDQLALCTLLAPAIRSLAEATAADGRALDFGLPPLPLDEVTDLEPTPEFVRCYRVVVSDEPHLAASIGRLAG